MLGKYIIRVHGNPIYLLDYRFSLTRRLSEHSLCCLNIILVSRSNSIWLLNMTDGNSFWSVPLLDTWILYDDGLPGALNMKHYFFLFSVCKFIFTFRSCFGLGHTELIPCHLWALHSPRHFQQKLQLHMRHIMLGQPPFFSIGYLQVGQCLTSTNSINALCLLFVWAIGRKQNKKS